VLVTAVEPGWTVCDAEVVCVVVCTFEVPKVLGERPAELEYEESDPEVSETEEELKLDDNPGTRSLPPVLWAILDCTTVEDAPLGSCVTVVYWLYPKVTLFESWPEGWATLVEPPVSELSVWTIVDCSMVVPWMNPFDNWLEEWVVEVLETMLLET